MIKQLVFDDASGARQSARSIDSNGFMRVANCPLTKEQVAPYLGREIPNFRSLGLEPDRIYQVYRPASELSKPSTINSVKGIPLLLDHAPVSPDDLREDQLVGSLGDAAKWDGTYLRCNLNILAKKAQDHIKDHSMRELSLSYAYTPVIKAGSFKGKHYDIVMKDIKANHLALVEAGRAGSDVRVCDSLPMELKKMDENTNVLEVLNKLLDEVQKQNQSNAAAVGDSDPTEEDTSTEEAIFKDDDEAAEDEEIAEDDDEAAVDSDEEVAEDDDEEVAEDDDEEVAEDDDEEVAEDEDPDEKAEDEDELAEDEDDEKYANILKGLGLDPSEDMIAALKDLATKVQSNGGGASDSAKIVRRAKARRTKAKSKRIAMDSKTRLARRTKAKSKRIAMDSKTLLGRLKAARDFGRKQGANEAIKRLRAITDAAEICKPILGKVKEVQFNSAAEIYRKAAVAAGMPVKYANDTKAAKGFVLSELNHCGGRKSMAMDSKIRNKGSGMAIVRNILNEIEG